MTMQTTPLTPPTPPTAAAVSGEAVVDLDAVVHNVQVLREHAGSAAVMAVVKADGYGHGATRVARAALRAGAAELGVATIAEALELRRDGITAPVLAWLHPPGVDFASALAADIQIGISSTRQLDEVLEAVRRTGTTAQLTVEVDTGRTTRLTQGAGDNEDPSWSPDGRFVAFSSTRAGGSHIWMSTAKGAHQVQLTSGKGGYTSPAWSPALAW